MFPPTISCNSFTQAIQIQCIQADFPLKKELIHVEQQREINKNNSHIKSLIEDKDSGYHFEKIGDANLILKHNKI